VPAPPPLLRSVSRPFWEGLRVGKLIVQRCNSCDRYFFYPRPFCAHCGSLDFQWESVAPHGTVYSFTEGCVPPSVDFRDAWPRLPAIVTLECGVRMATALVHIEPVSVRIGMSVRAVFTGADADPSFPPLFEPTRDKSL
jgi:uncharacterized protein